MHSGTNDLCVSAAHNLHSRVQTPMHKVALTCKEYQHAEQQHAEQNDDDGGALPRAARRQSLAEVQRRAVVVRGGAAHGAAWRQHRSGVAAVVALQRVLGRSRARRAALVFNRRSFVDICAAKKMDEKTEKENNVNIEFKNPP